MDTRVSKHAYVSEDDCKLFAMYNNDVRNSIHTLQNLLLAGVRTGSEYSQDFKYLLEDDIDRGLVKQKIMQLVKKL